LNFIPQQQQQRVFVNKVFPSENSLVKHG